MSEESDKAESPSPEEAGLRRALGRAFRKMGHERAPAYPGDKKDRGIEKEAQDSAETPEGDKKKKPPPRDEDFYISP